MTQNAPAVRKRNRESRRAFLFAQLPGRACTHRAPSGRSPGSWADQGCSLNITSFGDTFVTSGSAIMSMALTVPKRVK